MVDESQVHSGDCLNVLPIFSESTVDMIYLDPPFFTGKVHNSSTRDGAKKYSFADIWSKSEDYVEFLCKRLSACRRVMREHASIFVHSDHNNVHLARQSLDLVFGAENFRSEIIWFYKRWSNSARGLLQQHQTILHYSLDRTFRWNRIVGDYSPTTNVDQILQKRGRDARGKSVYSKDLNGSIVFSERKLGVPLGDVWEIPFLNPKAKERCGYPTQKPLLLLERIIQLSTDVGDLVVDPFCGSGTTLVAAKLLGRRYAGIDISPDAVTLTKERLASPTRTESALVRDGADAYRNGNPWVEAHLTGLSYSRVQRNSGLDAILRESIEGKPVFVRVQREGESLASTLISVKKALSTKGKAMCVIIATGEDLFSSTDPDVRILLSPAQQLKCLSGKATPLLTMVSRRA